MNPSSMKTILTKRDLLKALEEYNDDDTVVIEVHDTELSEDLYPFYIDAVDTSQGKEIRLCPKELPQEDPEEEVPITYGMIKKFVGWSRFCDITGHNHYAINEFGDYDEREVFKVKVSQAEKMGFKNLS